MCEAVVAFDDSFRYFVSTWPHGNRLYIRWCDQPEAGYYGRHPPGMLQAQECRQIIRTTDVPAGPSSFYPVSNQRENSDYFTLMREIMAIWALSLGIKAPRQYRGASC